MSDKLLLWEEPKAEEIYMIMGWRQWVDGGSISSGLPNYVREQTNARKIGEITPDDFYLFQTPVSQDLFRPLVKHNQGFTEILQAQRNEFYYMEINGKGLVIFIGDEPHLNAEAYVQTLLDGVKKLGVKRVIMFGGIYAEVPYDKERFISSIYSMKSLKEEVASLVVNLSDYQGGASIGSYVCKRAGDQNVEVIGLYTFSPYFRFPGKETSADAIQIGKDYKAWLDVMKRVDYMFRLNFDLDDLVDKSNDMIDNLDAKMAELDTNNPELGLVEYIRRLSDKFQEDTFSPLEDVWQDELRKLGDEFFPPEE